jgi:hypothetical protein
MWTIKAVSESRVTVSQVAASPVSEFPEKLSEFAREFIASTIRANKPSIIG